MQYTLGEYILGGIDFKLIGAELYFTTWALFPTVQLHLAATAY